MEVAVLLLLTIPMNTATQVRQTRRCVHNPAQKTF